MRDCEISHNITFPGWILKSRYMVGEQVFTGEWIPIDVPAITFTQTPSFSAYNTSLVSAKKIAIIAWRRYTPAF